jgi:heptaprenylglyceryl phosphate synthase
MKEKLLSIDPFANEEEVITIEELLIENRLDRISIHGSVDITKDKQGLEYAFALKRQIDTIVESLKREDLPERISVENVTKEVKNPFA